MPTVIQELPTSREGKGSADFSSSQTWRYQVKGVTTAAAAIAAVDAEAPTTVADPLTTWLTLIRSDITYKPLGNGIWNVDVVYEDPEQVDKKKQIETGDWEFDFNTTGGTATITTSLATVNSYAPAGKTATDYKQAIGVGKDGDVQGVQIVAPALRFGVRYRQPNATLTLAYMLTLRDLTGTYNDDTFFGFAAGEVLFLGSDGKQGTNSDPTVSYKFLVIENITGQTIGDIVNVDKLGHHYLWVQFSPAEDGTANKMARRPSAVYVERVYEPEDFSALGIGDGT